MHWRCVATWLVGRGCKWGRKYRKSGVGFSGFWALSHAQSTLTEKREGRRGNVNMEMLPASHFPEGEKKKNHDTLPHKKVLGKGVLCVCLAVGEGRGEGREG